MEYLATLPRAQETELINALLSIADRYGTPFLVLVAVFVFGWLGLRFITLREKNKGKVEELTAAKDTKIVEQLAVLVNQIVLNNEREVANDERDAKLREQDNETRQQWVKVYADSTDANKAHALVLEKLFQKLEVFSDAIPVKISENINAKQEELKSAVDKMEKESGEMKDELEKLRAGFNSLLQHLSEREVQEDTRYEGIALDIKAILSKLETLITDTQEHKAVAPPPEGE